MNTNHSNYTGKCHRTLQSAFGPYASGPIHDPKPEPMHRADKIVVTVSACALVALVVMAFAGWL